MRTHNVSSQLREQVRKYLEYTFKAGVDKNYNPMHDLQDISKYLRDEVLKDIYIKALHKVDFLKVFSQHFIDKLTLKMEVVPFY